MAYLMVRQHNVPAQDIAILSQYRAQCAEISKELAKKGEKFKDITVQTVVSAQGWNKFCSTVLSSSSSPFKVRDKHKYK